MVDHGCHRRSSRSRVKSWSVVLDGSWPVLTVSDAVRGKPDSFLRNVSNFARAGWTSAPPIDHVSARQQAASISALSMIALSSVSIEASILVNCSTSARLVIGVTCRSGSVISIVARFTMPSTTKSRHGSRYLSQSAWMTSRSTSFSRELSHFHRKGCHPMSRGSTYTMPHRETVAGEAYWRSNTSNSMEQVGKLSLMRSPLGRVSSLLSSITEFMFSTHNASTSPSYTMYLRSSRPSATGLFMSRKMFESSPSVQSRVAGSSTPYSSSMLMDFGLSTKSFVGSPRLLCARASVSSATVLPPPVGPTTMVVWRVIRVSYSWITLSTWISSCW
mmetsp:Transcript_10268/g.34023  ORF Transcript_10268/g.34023 Transcript_10268/m.34023 type:complete len:332 (-) Transcript_10268:24-1019(-)